MIFKRVLSVVFFSLFLLTLGEVFGQRVSLFDTLAAKKWIDLASRHHLTGNRDSAASGYREAARVFHPFVAKASSPEDIVVSRYIYFMHYWALHVYYQAYCDSAKRILDGSYPLAKRTSTRIDDGLFSIIYGDLHLRKNEIDSARSCYEKALESFRSMFGENHWTIGRTYVRLGNWYYHQYDYSHAKEQYLIGYEIYESIGMKTNRMMADVLSLLGRTAMNLHEYESALKYSLASLELDLINSPYDTLLLSEQYYSIGNICLLNQDTTEAAAYYQKALDLCTDRQSGCRSVYIIMTSLANAHALLGNDSLARRIFNQAINSFQRTQREDNPDFAFLFLSYGTYLLDHNEWDEGYQYIDQARVIYDKFQDKQYVRSATYIELARYYRLKGNLQLALQNLNLAFSANVRGWNDSGNVFASPGKRSFVNIQSYIDSYNNKAEVFFDLFRRDSASKTDLKNLLAAYEHYQYADTLIHRLRIMARNANERIRINEDNRYIYKGFLAVLYELFRETNRDKFLSEALNLVARNKSTVLQDIVDRQEKLVISDIPNEIIHEIRNQEEKIGLYSDLIQNSIDSTEQRRFNNLHVQAYLNYDRLLTQLEVSYPKYYDLVSNSFSINSEDVFNCLGEEEAVIEYFLTSTYLYTFLISKKGNLFTRNDIDSSFFSKIELFRKSINKMNPEKFVELGYDLYQKLLQPFEPHLEGISHLIVIPSGQLLMIPFESLLQSPGDPKEKIYDFSKVPYLINRFDISYHFSSRLWVMARNDTLTGQSSGIAGFAPSGFGDRQSDQPYSYQGVSRVEQNNFGELQFSQKEVDTLVTMYRSLAYPTEGYYGKEADEQTFRKQIGGKKIIHVASHSFCEKNNPSRCGIIFSPGGEGPKESINDGILHAYETYSLDMNADLLVLSSCESGVGQLMKSEGMMSLTRGFLCAGCRNVLFSLWKVPDRSTYKLMSLFHSEILRGQSYPSAVRSAKREMINDPATAFPKFWSGFVLIGN